MCRKQQDRAQVPPLNAVLSVHGRIARTLSIRPWAFPLARIVHPVFLAETTKTAPPRRQIHRVRGHSPSRDSSRPGPYPCNCGNCTPREVPTQAEEFSSGFFFNRCSFSSSSRLISAASSSSCRESCSTAACSHSSTQRSLVLPCMVAHLRGGEKPNSLLSDYPRFCNICRPKWA